MHNLLWFIKDKKPVYAFGKMCKKLSFLEEFWGFFYHSDCFFAIFYHQS